MDFHPKQPIEKQQHQEDESDQEAQPSPAKFPRLLLQLQPHPHHQQETALPLFAPPQQPNFSVAYTDSKPPLPPPTSTTFPCRVGGYFSTAQWQELEVQALIFRHMVAGASVPPQLLQLVKKSLLNSPSYHLNSYYQPALYQTAGSWGKANMDPEPGRCRRTDGKKWRCSRDVVTGHKYCERHVHRGRNRSRKPVESCIPTAATAASRQSGLVGGDGTHFSLSGPTSSLDIFQLNQGAPDPKPDGKALFKAQSHQSRDGQSKLRLFFDDLPKSDNTSIDDGNSTLNSATCLSISTPGENHSADFLKLSTSNGGNQVDSMGGPLAEAFRSSTGASSTGILHQLPQSASGTSCVTA